MRRSLAAVAVLVGLVAAEPALADCSTEVALAVTAQGKQKFMRKETQAVSDTGPFKMVVEYQLPDRMRQVVTPLTEGKPVESIVVVDKAWTNDGSGWKEAPKTEADQLVLFMIKSSSQMHQEVGKFECVGAETVEGRQLRAYRGIDEAPLKPLIKGLEASTADKNEAVRMVYLDPATGLPARSVFARAGFLDKPIFKEVYTYPTDIKIEPPKVAKK
jgi:hypothetical protein